jgi:hypothetical protein
MATPTQINPAAKMGSDEARALGLLKAPSIACDVGAKPVKEKREKMISIERVENGWIIRPFSPHDWSQGLASSNRIWVASTMPELLAIVDHNVENPDGPSLSDILDDARRRANHIPNEPV